MDDAQRRYEHERQKALPWRRWYGLKAWRVRKREQLRIEPTCRYCRAQGKSRIATDVDHVIPHRGDWGLFWRGALQSLCKPCHSGAKQREERRGFNDQVGIDGWPIDPRHPINRPSRAERAAEASKVAENSHSES